VSVSVDRWTCGTCGVTEYLEGTHDQLDEQRAQAQRGHAARHAAERSKVGSIADAISEALEQIIEFRVRLVVAGSEVERVRGMVVRRELPIEVFAGDGLEPGQGYVMLPRRGVRRR
jgi:ferredoxin